MASVQRLMVRLRNAKQNGELTGVHVLMVLNSTIEGEFKASWHQRKMNGVLAPQPCRSLSLPPRVTRARNAHSILWWRSLHSPASLHCHPHPPTHQWHACVHSPVVSAPDHQRKQQQQQIASRRTHCDQHIRYPSTCSSATGSCIPSQAATARPCGTSTRHRLKTLLSTTPTPASTAAAAAS